MVVDGEVQVLAVIRTTKNTDEDHDQDHIVDRARDREVGVGKDVDLRVRDEEADLRNLVGVTIGIIEVEVVGISISVCFFSHCGVQLY